MQKKAAKMHNVVLMDPASVQRETTKIHPPGRLKNPVGRPKGFSSKKKVLMFCVFFI